MGRRGKIKVPAPLGEGFRVRAYFQKSNMVPI
jgi:hypothetical protein